EHGPLLPGKLTKCLPEPCALGDLIKPVRDRPRGQLSHRQLLAPAPAPRGEKQREHHLAGIRLERRPIVPPAPPQVRLGQRLLDQVLAGLPVPGQQERGAAQRRPARRNEMPEFLVHSITSPIRRPGSAIWLTLIGEKFARASDPCARATVDPGASQDARRTWRRFIRKCGVRECYKTER